MNGLLTPPSAEDLDAFYAARRQIDPEAESKGLPKADAVEPANEMDESVELIEDLSLAFDVPEELVVKGLRITVASPTLEDLLNLFKALKAESASLQELADKSGDLADQMMGGDAGELSALLRTAPAARAVFMNAVHVDGKEFPDDKAKWEWYCKQLDALSAVEVLEMFMASTDWVKLIGKVRNIMGKLSGLAKQARQAGQRA